MTNTRIAPLSRRQMMLSGTAVVIFGAGTSGLRAQQNSVDVANRLAKLAGFEVLPRDLLANLQNNLDGNAMDRLTDDAPLPDAMRERVLTGLYTGVLPGADKDAMATRIGFSSALMWAAIDQTNNVISYCGGVPHFWAEPPKGPKGP